MEECFHFKRRMHPEEHEHSGAHLGDKDQTNDNNLEQKYSVQMRENADQNNSDIVVSEKLVPGIFRKSFSKIPCDLTQRVIN